MSIFRDFPLRKNNPVISTSDTPDFNLPDRFHRSSDVMDDSDTFDAPKNALIFQLKVIIRNRGVAISPKVVICFSKRRSSFS